jgi:hypothetical protein
MTNIIVNPIGSNVISFSKDLTVNTTVQSKSTNDLAEIIQKTHKVYDLMSNFWGIYRDLYEGLDTSKFIHRHPRESENSLRERRKRNYYLNFIEQIVNIYSGFMFRQPITRKFENNDSESQKSKKTDDDLMDLKKEIFKDFDRTGTAIDDFYKELSIWLFIYGTQHVVIDMPSEDNPTTFAEQLERRFLPFAVRVNPQQIINWSVDDFGQYNWIRMKQDPPSITDPFDVKLMSDTVKEEYYRTWTRSSWIDHKILINKDGQKKVEEIGKGQHNLETVPVVTFKSRHFSRSRVIGLSPIHDISFASIAVLNICSLLDEEMYQKALTLLAVKKSPDDKAELDLGGSNVLQYSGDQRPEFISPSLTPGEFFVELVETLSKEIFRMAKLGGGLTVLQEAMSGIAHAYLFNETNQALSDQADVLEAGEVRVLDIMVKWLDLDRGNLMISSSYPDDFGIVKMSDELSTLNKVKEEIPSTTLRKELAKDVAQVLLQGKSERDILDVIMEEIDAGIDQQESEKEEKREIMLDQMKNQQDNVFQKSNKRNSKKSDNKEKDLDKLEI